MEQQDLIDYNCPLGLNREWELATNKELNELRQRLWAEAVQKRMALLREHPELGRLHPPK